MTVTSQSQLYLPRVEIKFCVKCKWNLRAAYYAQELLQTFCSPPSEITLGEIALVPVSGGIFTVTLYHTEPTLETEEATESENKDTQPRHDHEHSLHRAGSDLLPLSEPDPDPSLKHHTRSTSIHGKVRARVTATQVWDRKADGGFPETKELKNRIRNLVDPSRNMGHVDRALEKGKAESAVGAGREGEVKEVTHQHKGHDGKVSSADAKEPDIANCEECRLAAQESLEDRIGRVTSG